MIHRYYSGVMDDNHQSTRPIVAVFVHLGEHLPNELIRNAENAISLNLNVRVLLLTDSTEKGFPGEIVAVDNGQLQRMIAPYLERFPEIKEFEGGYWEKTLTRLLALSYLKNSIDERSAVFHLESDVLMAIPFELILSIISSEYESSLPLYPRLGNKGIGSIIYFPDFSAISTFINHSAMLINSSKQKINDMELLGYALENNWAAELPSFPRGKNKSTCKHNSKFLLFDGAAVGQYLLGVNPIHTNGIIVSGYKNPYAEIDFSDVKWEVSNFPGSKFPTIKLVYMENIYFMANLHVHSKELLSQISLTSDEWKRIIYEANGGTRLERKIALASSKKTKLTFRTKYIIVKRIKIGGIARYIAKRTLRSIGR